uniref:ADAM metallopeptidase domain 17b n=1 Tax=Neogobius melanostomus TaxID=47308 RepID=A0A8C6SI99_9GOBI
IKISLFGLSDAAGSASCRFSGRFPALCFCSSDSLRSMLQDFDVVSWSGVQSHSVRRRELEPHSHGEKLLSFSALHRHFRLYLRTNEQLFSQGFRAVVVERGEEREIPVDRNNYYTGHVIGEEHSRVQALIDHSEFSARILTQDGEFNVEPLWRFSAAPPAGRLLVYRSEDIRNLSRVHQPSVCGYLHSDPALLLPDTLRERQREKRQTYDHSKNTCPLLLVADHRFFTHMGRGEESTTLNYLVLQYYCNTTAILLQQAHEERSPPRSTTWYYNTTTILLQYYYNRHMRRGVHHAQLPGTTILLQYYCNTTTTGT